MIDILKGLDTKGIRGTFGKDPDMRLDLLNTNKEEMMNAVAEIIFALKDEGVSFEEVYEYTKEFLKDLTRYNKDGQKQEKNK